LAIKANETLINVQNARRWIQRIRKGQFNDYGIHKKADYIDRS